MTDTVKLHVTIDIHVDHPGVDTGVPVDEWNAMDPGGRQAIVVEIWQAAAQQDGGGVCVVTPGAEAI